MTSIAMSVLGYARSGRGSVNAARAARKSSAAPARRAGGRQGAGRSPQATAEAARLSSIDQALAGF